MNLRRKGGRGGRSLGHVNWREVKWLWQGNEEGRGERRKTIFQLQGGIWGGKITRCMPVPQQNVSEGGGLRGSRSERSIHPRQQDFRGEIYNLQTQSHCLLLTPRSLARSPHGSTQQSLLPYSCRWTDRRTACSNSPSSHHCSLGECVLLCVVVVVLS